MKEFIDSFDKMFESRVRLAIMSLLMVNTKIEFKELKEKLNLSDGNLASHITALEKENYIEVKKQFVGKKPQTTYSATRSGKKAFADYIAVMEKFLKNGTK
ncbi:MAG TPA: transcriptional regulator [Bacteroidia bacterium]|nr:transcriptional regulator [Bacteroidia bacterium]HNU32992.1 transcriptional regulator [Bacteroidia bacterium]